MKDLASRVLNMAQTRGAWYADVRVLRRQYQNIIVKNGKVETLGFVLFERLDLAILDDDILMVPSDDTHIRVARAACLRHVQGARCQIFHLSSK